MDDNINDESKIFIDWVCKEIQETGYLNLLVEELKQNLKRYCMSKDVKLFSRDLKQKMILGAMEHKNLKTSRNEIVSEIHAEMIDLICWSMMLRYVERNKK